MIVVGVVVATLFATQAPVADAGALEDQAHAAYEAKKWCDAFALFLAADEALPNPTFLFNAGRSAENAGDIPRAVEIYGKLLGVDTDAARIIDVRSRIQKLTQKIGAPDAPHVECPALKPPPTTTTTTTTTTTPAVPKDVHPYATVGTITIVGGSVAVVGGGAALVIASLYWSDYDAARINLEATVTRDGTNATTLAKAGDTEARRASYNSIGVPLYWLGGVLVGAGVVAAGAGIFAATISE